MWYWLKYFYNINHEIISVIETCFVTWTIMFIIFWLCFWAQIVILFWLTCTFDSRCFSSGFLFSIMQSNLLSKRERKHISDLQFRVVESWVLIAWGATIIYAQFIWINETNIYSKYKYQRHMRGGKCWDCEGIRLIQSILNLQAHAFKPLQSLNSRE